MRTRIEKRPLWAKLVVMLLSSLLAGTVSLRLLAAPPALSELSTGGKSSLVFPGRDGRLVYKTDGDGNRICDFSYAGYKGGGVAIPDVRVEATVAPSGRDDTGSIQQAVDRVGENGKCLFHFMFFGSGGSVKFVPFHSARISR